MIGRLNHVAIAVPDLIAASALYRDTLGAKVNPPQDEPDHGVTVVFIELPNTKIELLYPLGENSPIQGFLDKNPSGGIHHICYEVEDILAARDKLKAAGARVLGSGDCGDHADSSNGCWAAASPRSARMESRYCSCIRKISPAHWSNWSKSDEPRIRRRIVSGFLVHDPVRGPAPAAAKPKRSGRGRARHTAICPGKPQPEKEIPAGDGDLRRAVGAGCGGDRYGLDYD